MILQVFNEFHQMIEDWLTKRCNELKKDKPIHKNFRAGDVRHSQVIINKTEELLDYQPQHRVS